MSDEFQKARGRTVYIAVFLSTIASILTTYGLRALDGTVEEHGLLVKVPDLVGMPLEEAREAAKNRGLELTVVAERHSMGMEGEVLNQAHFPDSEVSAGSLVEVVVSMGPHTISLPSLRGQSVEEARTQLSALGLELGAQSEGGEGEAGSIFGSDPEAGSEVAVGSSIAVVVVPQGAMVPEVIGRNYRTVRTELQALGLRVNIRRSWDDFKPPLSVMSVDPAEGERVEQGTVVTLTINE